MAQVDHCVYESGYSLDAGELAKYGASERFTSLSSFESGADIDWVSATNNPVCDILESGGNWSGSPDTSEVTWHNWVLNTTYPLLVQALGSAAVNKTTWDSTAYILQGDGTYTMNFSATPMYVQYKGMQFEQAGSTGSTMIYPRQITNLEFNSCRFNYSCSTADAIIYYDELSGSKLIRLWNCILEGSPNYGIRARDADMYLYHCLVTGASTAALRDDSTYLNLYNSAIYNCTDDFNGTFGARNFNASDDNEGSNSQNLNENASGEWTAAWVSYSTGDYAIDSTSSLLYDNGNDMTEEFTDLTGETDPLAIDALGNARTRWDIGPFEYQAPVGGTVVPMASHHLTKNMGSG